jgi:hypothetical protein
VLAALFAALLKLADLLMKPLGGMIGRRRELRAARDRVVRRLKGLLAADERKVWDDEKWHLGPELDRLSEAIAQAKAGPEWRRAEERARERVLLKGERDAIDDSVRELEALR